MLDKHTFGDSASAIYLADRLSTEEDSKYLSRVQRYLSQNNGLIHQISKLDNNSFKTTFYKLLFNKWKTDKNTIPKHLQTRMVNLLVGRARDEILRK